VTTRAKAILVRIVLGLWTVVLLAMVAAEALERRGLDVPLSVRMRHAVRVGVPSGWPSGGHVVVERAATGKILDYGVLAVAIELVDPVPYSEVRVEGSVTRIRHVGGIYDDYETFFDGPFADATLNFTDGGGVTRSVVVRLGYPDVDTSSGTLIWHAELRGDLIPGLMTDVVMTLE
jgi:hypothetical protein